MKFWAVRIIAGLQIAIGSLVLLCSLFMFLVAADVVHDKDVGYGATTISALIALGLFLAGVVIIAQGQILQVFLQIEENTRSRIR